MWLHPKDVVVSINLTTKIYIALKTTKVEVWRQGNQVQTEIAWKPVCSSAFSLFRPNANKLITYEMTFHKRFL
jgi:hypothetical protein